MYIIFKSKLLTALRNSWVYLGVRTCELFICFAPFVFLSSIVQTSSFPLFHVTREFNRFLHRGWAKFLEITYLYGYYIYTVNQVKNKHNERLKFPLNKLLTEIRLLTHLRPAESHLNLKSTALHFSYAFRLLRLSVCESVNLLISHQNRTGCDLGVLARIQRP